MYDYVPYQRELIDIVFNDRRDGLLFLKEGILYFVNCWHKLALFTGSYSFTHSLTPVRHRAYTLRCMHLSHIKLSLRYSGRCIYLY